MSEDLYRLIQDLEAEILCRSLLAQREPDMILRNGHLHIVSLLRRTIHVLRSRPDAPRKRK